MVVLVVANVVMLVKVVVAAMRRVELSVPVGVPLSKWRVAEIS